MCYWPCATDHVLIVCYWPCGGKRDKHRTSRRHVWHTFLEGKAIDSGGTSNTQRALEGKETDSGGKTHKHRTSRRQPQGTRFCRDGKTWLDKGRHGKTWKDMVGHGKTWKDMVGHGRTREDKVRHTQSCPPMSYHVLPCPSISGGKKGRKTGTCTR